MKKTILSLMFAVVALSLFASNNSVNKVAVVMKATLTEIKGKVVDPATNEAIAGASVVINGKKVYTDLDGKFIIKEELSDKACQVSVSMISYDPQTFVVRADEMTDLEIALKK
ncbi:MAG: carboxypeptidase-like regulatory domain-containing protein [Bacteroidales bacterium]